VKETKTKDMNQEMHDKAWNLLEEKGLKLGEMIMVRANFASMNKDDLPFIRTENFKGKVTYFSTITQIGSWIFSTEQEVNLANAMVLAMGDKFEINSFMHQYKMVLRMLQIESKWAE
jgi:hypothetical protein